MGFTKKTLALRNTEHLVWQRDPLEGNLVIVVIDDECRYARADSDKVLILDQAIFPQLREHVCSWEETRSIGFFPTYGHRRTRGRGVRFDSEVA